MDDADPKIEHEPKQTLVETLENQLKVGKDKVEKDIIKVIHCNIKIDIQEEIDSILKDIKSNMTFVVALKIIITLIMLLGLIFLLVKWIFFG